MASVPLSFIPPDESGITALHIFESAQPDSGFDEIEIVAAIGAYPNYISHYTTSLAVSATDWFAIAWENAEGAVTELSNPIKGGTTTLVGELVDRTRLRLPVANEAIVAQEAEAVVCYIYQVDDPYSIDPNTVDKLWITELTNLVIVAVQYVTVSSLTSIGQSYTVGMVSQSSSTGMNATTIIQSLESIEKRALKRLGLSGSLLATISDRLNGTDDVSSITGIKTAFDSSRVLSARAIITEDIIVQDLATGTVISR